MAGRELFGQLNVAIFQQRAFFEMHVLNRQHVLDKGPLILNIGFRQTPLAF